MEGPFRRADLTDPGLRLIETMLWNGRGFPRLPGHLARLERSAARFGWPCDPEAVTAALAGMGPAPARVRLTLDAQGRPEVTAAPLPPSPGVWRLGLAFERLDPADIWLTVKSTRRAAHDTARAAMAPGLDEVLFINSRGEVCEGTITTLFFDRGQGLCTPPLASGLLPGVLRAELLAGDCREEVLAPEDLPRARLWVGNALRGLMPALLAEG